MDNSNTTHQKSSIRTSHPCKPLVLTCQEFRPTVAGTFLIYLFDYRLINIEKFFDPGHKTGKRLTTAHQIKNTPKKGVFNLVRDPGIEPGTLRLSVVRSNQLS